MLSLICFLFLNSIAGFQMSVSPNSGGGYYAADNGGTPGHGMPPLDSGRPKISDGIGPCGQKNCPGTPLPAGFRAEADLRQKKMQVGLAAQMDANRLLEALPYTRSYEFTEILKHHKDVYRHYASYDLDLMNAYIAQDGGICNTLAFRAHVKQFDDKYSLANAATWRLPDSDPTKARRYDALGAANYIRNESVHLEQNAQLHDAEVLIRLATNLVDVATNFIPGISWGRDLYEALVGRDLFTNENMGTFGRTMAVVGVITGGLGVPMSKGLQLLGRFMNDHKPIEYASKILANEEKMNGAQLIELASFLRPFKFRHEKRIETLAAFTPNAKLKTAAEDFTVHRYYSVNPNTPSNPHGNWVTRYLVEDPQRDLALFVKPPYEVKTWTVPKGSKYLEGTAEINNGFPGGANQILIHKDNLR